MPAGVVLVAKTGWPAVVKAIASGVLLVGVEIVVVPAVALTGVTPKDPALRRA